MGECAARGADHGVEAGAGGLLHDLLGGEHVAEPTERRMPGRGMNYVRPAALGREHRRAPFHRRVRRRLVLALGERVQGCAQHPVEQQVARHAVSLAAVRHPLFELDVDCHSEFARGGSGDAHQIRLHRAGDQHRVRAACPGLAEVELELAHLVAAEREAGAVVALDPEIDAKRRAQVRGRIDRCRRVAEPDPRKPVDGGKRAGHDGGGPGWSGLSIGSSVSRHAGRGAVQCPRLQANSAENRDSAHRATPRLQFGSRPTCRPWSALSVAAKQFCSCSGSGAFDRRRRYRHSPPARNPPRNSGTSLTIPIPRLSGRPSAESTFENVNDDKDLERVVRPTLRPGTGRLVRRFEVSYGDIGHWTRRAAGTDDLSIGTQTSRRNDQR